MEREQVGTQRSPDGPARARPVGSVAVVTVTALPDPALDRFVDSVKAASSLPVPVLVADGGSVDGVPTRATQRAGVSLLHLGEDIGRAGGANRGIAELGDGVEWIAVADPDVEWGEGALDELLAAAARYPRAGVLGPRLRGDDGPRCPAPGELPPCDVLSVLTVALGRPPVALGGQALVPALAGLAGVGWPGAAGRPVRAAIEGPVGWVDGRCLLLRRAAWESVDGFDARYPQPYDAVDLGDRLGRAGWLCVHVPSAQVTVPPQLVDPDAADRGHRRYLTERLTGPARGVLSLALRLPWWRNAC